MHKGEQMFSDLAAIAFPPITCFIKSILRVSFAIMVSISKFLFFIAIVLSFVYKNNNFI